MASNRPHELPRPEDRRRGDLERWLGGRDAQTCWRSEAFAEDLPPAPPLLPAAAPPHAPTGHRPVRPGWVFAALALGRLR
jgi:hypothetical protein